MSTSPRDHCKRNHPVPVSRNDRGDCLLCLKERLAEWKQRNPEKVKGYVLKSRLKNRPKCRNCGTEIPHPSSGRLYCAEGCSKEVHLRRGRERRAEAQADFKAYKESIGCARCGFRMSGSALDFHHPNGDKERRVAANGWRTKKAQAEIAKCILLCANCHRMEHHEDVAMERNGDVYTTTESAVPRP